MEQRVALLEDFVTEDDQPNLEAASFSLSIDGSLERALDTARAFDVSFQDDLALIKCMVWRLAIGCVAIYLLFVCLSILLSLACGFVYGI